VEGTWCIDTPDDARSARRRIGRLAAADTELLERLARGLLSEADPDRAARVSRDSRDVDLKALAPFLADPADPGAWREREAAAEDDDARHRQRVARAARRVGADPARLAAALGDPDVRTLQELGRRLGFTARTWKRKLRDLRR
jgi:hypothetical protein